MFSLKFMPRYIIDEDNNKKENIIPKKYMNILKKKDEVEIPYLNIEEKYLQLSTERIKGNPVRIKKNKKEYTILNKKQTSSLTLNNNNNLTTTVRNNVQVSINKVGTGELTVTSSNNNIATATISGDILKITTDKAGTARITVTMKESEFYEPCSSTINVTVNKYQSSISFSRSSLTLSESSDTETINIYKNGEGEITVTNPHPEFLTTYFNGSNQITATGLKVGASTIVVSISETEYYQAASSTIVITSNVHEKITSLPYTFTVPDTGEDFTDVSGIVRFKLHHRLVRLNKHSSGSPYYDSSVRLYGLYRLFDNNLKVGDTITINSYKNNFVKEQRHTATGKQQYVYDSIFVVTKNNSVTKELNAGTWAKYSDTLDEDVAFVYLYLSYDGT